MSELDNNTFPETSRSLSIAMLRAREAMMLSFRPVLAKHGFTEQQWRVLRVLGEKGTSDAGQVAFDACILAPSLSRIIGKLEKDNYISRFIDSKDGRRVNLSLTKTGQDTLNKIAPDMELIYKAIQKRYGEEKLTNLLDILSEISEWRGR
ncbi:homoprotocatechuate degradation operon regulator HpaR [Alphaproteobacteria bacterium]|jgi:homoprotocatechuate degradation regulator HpaR|nr:homoprotocatechuate degradation operon regulator HpaR [Alphaproteobacteria bacterium]